MASVTIQEIAKQAGVSKSAVSAVLGSATRSGTRVGAATRVRIQEVARQMNYKTNMLAKGLAGGRTKTIGLLWSMGGPHPSQSMANNIALRMQRHGYVTNLSDHIGQWNTTAQILTDLRQRCVDAVVIQNSEILMDDPKVRQLCEEFPAAVFVCEGDWDVPGDIIIHDIDEAMRDAARHLLALGRKRVGILGGVGGSLDHLQSRFNAAVHTLREGGGVIDRDSVIPMDFTDLQEARAQLRARFADARGKFPFDSLLCGNDEAAAFAMAFLRERGLRVPQDVVVIGFNDAIFAGAMVPPLASIAREDDQVASAIEKILFRRLEEPELPPQREMVRMRFVWRESAGGSAKLSSSL